MATKRVPPKLIDADSTIASMVEGLDKPVEYVRRVLEKLERCKRAHGDAQVRVGVRGRAEAPNYLIEYVREDKKTLERVTYQDAAYSGSTHRELAAHHIAEARNWSPEEMNITAVSALIGRLRNPRAPSSRFSDED
jgi:translation initiation factor 2 alpha subunit (eIF-2alpha)